MTARSADAGVILVHVLVALALGAAMVTLMLTSQDIGIDRARRAAALAQAESIALGAEASVLVALRRDMSEAPETDHLQEAWATVAQTEVELGPGRFSVTLRDRQGAFDLNGIARGSLVGQQAFLRLIAVLGLPPDVAATVLGALAQRGQLQSLDEVAALTPDVRDRLRPHIAFLPMGGGVNLNSAGPEVMAAMIGSATAATRLIATRARAGFLTEDDLRAAGVVTVAGAGLVSDNWEAVTRVEVDDVLLTLVSRFVRVRGPGRLDVEVVSRRFGDEAGSMPPLP